MRQTYRIIVIDDDPITRMDLVEMLQEAKGIRACLVKPALEEELLPTVAFVLSDLSQIR